VQRHDVDLRVVVGQARGEVVEDDEDLARRRQLVAVRRHHVEQLRDAVAKLGPSKADDGSNRDPRFGGSIRNRLSPTPPHPTPAFPFNVMAFPINVMAFPN
jgi:hypothetical protein